MNSHQPWAYPQLIKAMKDNGWVSMGEGSYYHSHTGKIVNLRASTDERGIEWHYWTDLRQIPPKEVDA